MQVVLIRVGIDTGCGGIHGPLFRDGSFEYIPIPDRFHKRGIDSRTYGTVKGRKGRPLIEYFPRRLREKYQPQPIHFDPEFETFTYGDPGPHKARFVGLNKGDLLVLYAGLEGWGSFQCDPALYIIGFFSVFCAGLPLDLERKLGRSWKKHFIRNFHVKHRVVFDDQEDRLVLVKGDEAKSKLLKRAVLISSKGQNCNGTPIYVLSPEMQKIFGDFDGHTCIQRCPPRWVYPKFSTKAADFVSSLK
jgi:Nucleotide modification associated domain 3